MKTTATVPNFRNSKLLITFFKNAWMDAWLAIALVVEIKALPLFINITQIVGGVLVSIEKSRFLYL